MIITYAPKGAEAQVFEFKFDDLLDVEAEAIERVTGKTFDVAQVELQQGSATCRRAFLWVLLKRGNPALRHGDVKTKVGEITVEYDREERAKVRAELLVSQNVTEEERDAALAFFADDDPAGQDPKVSPDVSGSDSGELTGG